jgi:hypothetical protein
MFLQRCFHFLYFGSHVISNVGIRLSIFALDRSLERNIYPNAAAQVFRTIRRDGLLYFISRLLSETVSKMLKI